jgi:hypothetical protein
MPTTASVIAVAAACRRSRRGEGGGTPKFSETVNNMIVEDRNIEPLITGLINVSGLLANVAAGAIGTSPEGVVGAPLEIYGPLRSTNPTGFGKRARSML